MASRLRHESHDRRHPGRIRRAPQAQWETTLGEVFTDLAAGFPSDFRAITVTQLLSHHRDCRQTLPGAQIAQSAPALPEQRLNALKIAATTKLTSQPGTKYGYSNLGYTLAGAIAERVSGQSWEELMREIVFKPLGMTNCGFGGLGTLGKINQPWPHTANGQPMASNGPAMDNLPVQGPAGTVHCSIADWSKFIADQLRGERGAGALLKTETTRRCTHLDSEVTMHSVGASPHELGRWNRVAAQRQ